MQKKLAHRAFRLQLAKELTGTYTARQTAGGPSRVESFARYTERHFPKELDSAVECVHCSNINKRKRTKFGLWPMWQCSFVCNLF